MRDRANRLMVARSNTHPYAEHTLILSFNLGLIRALQRHVDNLKSMWITYVDNFARFLIDNNSQLERVNDYHSHVH